MKLYEFMAKEIFANHGISVPKGLVNPGREKIEALTAQVGEVVVKSQILSGGRGKAGGIKFTTGVDETEKAVNELKGSQLKGLSVEHVLVEEKLFIEKEMYLAITIDGGARKPVLIASASGGMDIEDVAEENIVKIFIDIRVGVQPYLGREVARKLGLTGAVAKEAAKVIANLYRVFQAYDAELVEINPLVISGEKVIAADGKMTIDDEATFRYPKDLPLVEEKTEREKLAHDIGISYVELDGDIAVMANGAGITMATLDIIQHYGGQPANFMDAGGGSGMEATAKALEILISTKPKAILVNIFGGITRCDDVAKAFVQVKDTRGIPVPMVIRLVGTNEDEGVRILRENGFHSYRTIKEAVGKVVAIAKENCQVIA